MACATRIKQHNKTKDWWTTVLVCVSKTAGFTKAHAKYLEWYCHKEAGEAGRYVVDNSSSPTKSHVSEPMQADLMDHFETIRILASRLGYPVFDRIERPKGDIALKCKGKKAVATGEYTEDGFVVFAGSIANRTEVASTHGYVVDIRRRLLHEGVLQPVDENTLKFAKNYIFPSPSQAAAVVLARNANGWIEWKYPDGRTLDEVKRKSEP